MSQNNPLSPSVSNNSTKLAVPNRHSYATSVSSFSHSNNQPKMSRAGSSGYYRLSRSNTNMTADNYSSLDTQSVATIDKIPPAKPSVTYSDKLWTQIDVLDDVKSMANEVRTKGSFFNDKFNQELEKLKASQEKLLNTMSTQQFNDLNTNEHQKQHIYQLNTINTVPHPSESLLKEDKILHENEDDRKEQEKKNARQEKINSFFRHDDKEEELEFKNQVIYRKENFDEINRYVSQIKKDLKGLGESMKKFDESTREIW
ncbi:hypothetical protein SBY92_004056 [Candida maltosa Xu316]|uniref:Uncharacterized protein n=1 Tax=Candida maltosa (strain Xu316) TaxID=1245528 RepID=M3J9G0_CANMX|nr:hypothetical protein G210_0644 [Candida maltosa Xu316]